MAVLSLVSGYGTGVLVGVLTVAAGYAYLTRTDRIPDLADVLAPDGGLERDGRGGPAGGYPGPR